MSITTVDSYMTKNLITLDKNMNVFYAIGLLLKNNISGAPVIDSNKELIGILSEKDCLRILADDSYTEMNFENTMLLGRGTVESFMTKSVSSINSGADLNTVAEIFLKNNFRRLPVLKNNKIIGQISRRDVLKAINDIKNYNES